jgi:hypothetical protein
MINMLLGQMLDKDPGYRDTIFKHRPAQSMARIYTGPCQVQKIAKALDPHFVEVFAGTESVYVYSPSPQESLKTLIFAALKKAFPSSTFRATDIYTKELS